MTREETETDESGSGEGYPQIPGVMIIDVIGQGGQGSVYRATQTYLDRIVAVKVLHEVYDEYYAKRFQREAKTLAAMSHASIVACYDAGQLPSGHCYMIMEHIDGPNLSTYVQENGPLEPVPALRVGRQIAEALRHAYREKVIHRDVKPPNILLKEIRRASPDFPYRACLVDLGLARPECNPVRGSDLTGKGQWQGTLETMAPEQFDDPDGVDCRADMYGLGCSMFQALTGRKAFYGSQSVMISTKLKGAPDMSKLPHIPASVAALVGSLLAPDREQRPSSYEELIQRIDEALEGLGADPGTEEHSTTVRPVKPPPSPSVPRWLLLGAAAVLVIGVGGAAYLMRGDPADDSSGEVVASRYAESLPLAWSIGDGDRRSRALAVTPSADASEVVDGLPLRTAFLPDPVNEGDRVQISLQIPEDDPIPLDDSVRWRVEGDGVEGYAPSKTDPCGFVWTVPERRQDFEGRFLLVYEGKEARERIRLRIEARADDDPIAFELPTPTPAVEGSQYTLEGAASDPDGTVEDLRWSQRDDGSPRVRLTSEGEGRASFPVPTGLRARSLRFCLQAGAAADRATSETLEVPVEPTSVELRYLSATGNSASLLRDGEETWDHWERPDPAMALHWLESSRVEEDGPRNAVAQVTKASSYRRLNLPRTPWKISGVVAPIWDQDRVMFSDGDEDESPVAEAFGFRVVFGEQGAISLGARRVPQRTRYTNTLELLVAADDASSDEPWKLQRVLDDQLKDKPWREANNFEPGGSRMHFEVDWSGRGLRIRYGDMAGSLEQILAAEDLPAALQDYLPTSFELYLRDGKVRYEGLRFTPQP